MLIGNLGSLRRAEAGAGGAITLPERTQLSWWVRSADRWHVPSADVTARDWLLDQAPVLATAVRVPGGDVTSHTYATVQGRRELVAWEITNASPAPLAVAFVVRSGNAAPITLDGTTVLDGGRPVAYLPAAPADVIAGPLEPHVAGSGADRDAVAPDVLGHATEAAFVFTVLHRGTARCAALLGVSSATASLASPVLSSLPDPHMVARGWGLAAGSVARVDGDGRRANRIRSLATALLLHADRAAAGDLRTRAAVAHGLARVGAHDDAARLLDGLDDAQHRSGALDPNRDPVVTAEILSALITVARHAPSPVLGHAHVPLIAGALEFVHRSTDEAGLAARAGLFLEASRLLARVGEARAARRAEQVWSQLGGAWPLAPFREPEAVAITAGAQLVPGDPFRLTNALVTELDALVAERSDGAMDCFAGWDQSALLGQSAAVHQVSTPAGVVSVALRWHGARPALLWESELAPADRIMLRCSVLDPSWSSQDATGEALLAAPVTT